MTTTPKRNTRILPLLTPEERQEVIDGAVDFICRIEGIRPHGKEDLTMTASTAKKKLTALKRQRHSRHHTGPCSRCGGQGGWQGWPGFTCYRCGGQGSMHFERWVERYWPTPELEAEAAELEAIIEADRAEKAAAAAAIRLAEQKERDHAAAIREDGWRAEKAAAPYLGTPGGKLEFTGTVLSVLDIETMYGVSLLVLVKDDETSAIIKTFGTGKTLWSLSKGDRVSCVATVKDHELYQGAKQTVVTRSKFTVLSTEEIDHA